MPQVHPFRIEAAMRLGVVLACVEAGFGILQDLIGPKPLSDGSISSIGFGGIGVIYLCGLLFGTGIAVLCLLLNRPATLESISLATVVALVAALAVIYSGLSPKIQLLVPGIILAASISSRRLFAVSSQLPFSVKLLTVVIWSATTGAGVGFWQMGFTTPGEGILRPDDVFSPFGALTGGVFGGVGGLLIYGPWLRGVVSLRTASIVVTSGFTAGCSAAPILGAPSFMITVLASVLGAVLSAQDRSRAT